MKRAIATTGGGFLAGLVSIGIAWLWLAITEDRLYQGLYFENDL